MSLLEDCREISELYDRDRKNQSIIRKLIQILNKNTRYADLADEYVFNYENIGKEVVEAFKVSDFALVKTEEEKEELARKMFYLRNNI